jgi:SAM-dependent methyltransferase
VETLLCKVERPAASVTRIGSPYPADPSAPLGHTWVLDDRIGVDVTGLAWSPSGRQLDCRGCGFTGEVPGLLSIPVPGLAEPLLAVSCPRCASVDLRPEIFDSDPTDESVDVYLEVGAGIEVIAELVDSLGPGGGARLLDVGSGFGFGVDYAVHERGWSAVGVEPSVAGARGARELGLDIRTGYFGPGWSSERFTAILSSEVLEHVPDPRAFVRALAEHLEPDGQVVLTTPDPLVVDPASPEADVHSVVSGGYHFALYSREAVAEMFRDAGFTAVRIDRIGLSHRVRARLDGAEPLDGNHTSGVARASYLARRARGATGSLALGLTTRALRRAVAAGEWTTARRYRRLVRREFRRRYRVDPTRVGSVDRLLDAGGLPGALGGAVFALGMIELLDGSAVRAARYFERSIRVLAARQKLSMSDADSSDILEQSRFHRVLALARTAPATAASEAMTELTPSTDDGRVAAHLARVYVELVARGALAEVEGLERQVAVSAPLLAASGEAEQAIAGRDALFSIGVRHLQIGEPERARPWLERARASAVSGPHPSPGLAHAIDSALAAAPPAMAELSHYLDVYWCDPHGAYLEGWIHADGDPGAALHVVRADTAILASRHDREDLVQYWPDTPEVRRSGFRVHVPGPPLPALEFVLTTPAGEKRLTLEMPDHRRPVADADPTPEDVRARLTAIAASAPAGPVLSIGARTHEAEPPTTALVDFGDRPLVGLDIHPGFHVDIVGDAHRLSELVDAGTYSIVYSASLLEHVAAPWLVAAEIARALPIGGIALHVAPWLWPTHSQPNDFWRFSDAGLRRLFGPDLGFEFLDGGGVFPAAAIPTPAWRSINPGLATFTTPTTTWIAVRKIDDRANSIAWPYAETEGREVAERYPLDGLARDIWESE